MKLKVKAEVDFEIQLKDVLSFLMEDKLSPQQYDAIIMEANKRKQGFWTMNDQQKIEIFDQHKSRFTAEEIERRLL